MENIPLLTKDEGESKMTVGSVSEQHVESKTFKDRDGNSYDITNIHSISRGTAKSSVGLDVDGQQVFVEVTPTEAMNLLELMN